MTLELILHSSAAAPGSDVALAAARERLAAARTSLAEREAELAQLRARLQVFEVRYLRQVGILYAELDDLEARIAEREVDLYDSATARERAAEARQRAQETHQAAFAAAHEAPEFEPPPDLRTLFREVAKRIHPDFARDAAEQQHFTRLMARANQAYRRGDTDTLQRLLDDHSELHAALPAEEAAAEFHRITRQLRHAERDIAALEAEQHSLLASEIAQLYTEAEAATREHRDLLTELAAGLREQIADARHRFELVDRQISAHGR